MKKCEECNSSKLVFNRNINNHKILLCQKCYRKCLDICIMCRRHSIIFAYSNENKAICKKCFIEPYRICKICKKEFPAGRGRICYECSIFNSLSKKISVLNVILSPFTNLYFEQFTWWLVKRKGTEYAANYIQKYFVFFYKIDKLASDLEKIPTYTELLNNFKVSYTRKYLLVMIFFNEHKIIIVNEETKELYSNLNMIDSYVNYFNKNDYEYNIIKNYNLFLQEKILLHKTTIRSVRLALGPAIKLLKYKYNFNISKLNDDIISGYLWIYPGQKSSLSGFINYLNNTFNYNLSSINNINCYLEPSISRKKQLQLRLIFLLKKQELSINEKRRLINITLEYFHRIKVPRNVYLNKKNIFKIKNNSYICCCKTKFYIPENIYYKINKT